MPKIKSIRPIGKHQTYDLEVDHPDHQFYLSNGLLTSNSHSHTYSVMTMQCAHLATYHPLEFYASVLSNGQAGELQEYVSDIKQKGIKILPVDVNKSRLKHVEEDGAIRLSPSSIDGVGPAGLAKIMDGQPYSGFLDFLERSKVGKTAIAPLIHVGAFSAFDGGGNMKALETFYEKYCADPKLRQKKNRSTLEQMWQRYAVDCELDGSPIEDYKLHEKVFLENQIMGFSLVGSPFDILERTEKIGKLFDGVPLLYQDFVTGEQEEGVIAVVVKEVKERAQRNGQLMAFLKFGVESGEEFDSPCFSTIWKWIAPTTRKGSVYLATFNRREDDPQNLIVGRAGFAHSQHSATQYMIDVDAIDI